MVQPEQHLVYAIHEYAIPGSVFLPLKAGDVIHVDDADETGWWLGTNLREQKGLFPSTYTLPYFFPTPPEDMVSEMRLILLGHSFGVQVVSGAPLPLVKSFEAEVGDADGPLPSLAVLCKSVEKRLLDREAARVQVMGLLSQLLRMRVCEREEREKLAQGFAAQQQQVAERQAVLKERCVLLQASLCKLAARKSELLQKGIIPTFTWYEKFNNLSVAAAPLSDSLSIEGAWRSALKDLKELVKRQEEELSHLSESCAKEEDDFERAVSSLQARIEWRDGNVARMLSYWEDKAHAVKTAYTAAKVERDTVEERRQVEAVQLRYRLEEGRELFIKSKAEYRELKRRAEEIAALLQRKSSLDLLSQQIAEADAVIAKHQQR